MSIIKSLEIFYKELLFHNLFKQHIEDTDFKKSEIADLITSP